MTGCGAVPHLTYCTNVHPGEGWPDIAAQIRRHVPAVKALVAPDERFGIGLRMSADAAAVLRPGSVEFHDFRAFLAAHGLYVFTINGFPQGTFHGTRVKDTVYRPDWREPERLTYADALARLLVALMEGEPAGVEGSVSTVPGAYKAHLAGAADRALIADNLLRHAVTLDRLARDRGRVVALALEPEPGCLLETTAETVAFFEEHLFSGAAVARFAGLAGLGRGEAEAALRRHLGVCLDTCHAAVMFESAEGAVDCLLAAGIRIAKIQLSSGLVLPSATAEGRAALAPFAEDVYLHQVAARQDDGEPVTFPDLPDALASAGASPQDEAEWRVHFHVPVWADRCGPFATTQDFLAAILERQRRQPLSAHLEVETYTWDVLPPAVRPGTLTDSLARELTWVLQHLR
ncbi:metabolite traffic protein EboE [Azospirillum sp. sgz302134]